MELVKINVLLQLSTIRKLNMTIAKFSFKTVECR